LQHSDRSIFLLHLADRFIKAFPLCLGNAIVIDSLNTLTACASVDLAQELIDVSEGVAVEQVF
jgi:hypothetical protein